MSCTLLYSRPIQTRSAEEAPNKGVTDRRKWQPIAWMRKQRPPLNSCKNLPLEPSATKQQVGGPSGVAGQLVIYFRLPCSSNFGPTALSSDEHPYLASHKFILGYQHLSVIPYTYSIDCARNILSEFEAVEKSDIEIEAT